MKKKMSEQERKALQAKLRDLEELYAAGYRYAARNQSGELRAYKKNTLQRNQFLVQLWLWSRVCYHDST